MMNLLLAEGTSTTSSILMLVILGGLIVLMLVLPSIGQKKRMAAYQEMQSKLKAGDKVQTVGGIIGRIVKINEKDGVRTMILETGDKNNKTTMEFNLDAIAGVVQNPTNTAVATTVETQPIETEVIEDEENPTEFNFESINEIPEIEKPTTTPKSKKKK